MPGAEIVLDALLIGLKHLDTAIDLVSKLVGEAPTQAQLAKELAARGERLLLLSAGLVAKQAKDQAALDARIPPGGG
jgi:hypothetical protein